MEPAIEWDKVFAEARETDTSRMVAVGLLLASELLGVSLPHVVLERINADGQIRALVATVSQRLNDQILTPASAVESVSFNRRAFERTRHRVRFAFGIFLEPTEAEYQALKLPPSLHWLYYFFRPLRLASKYARTRA